MDHEIKTEVIDWMARGRIQVRNLVNMVIHSWLPLEVKNVLSSYATIRFLRRLLRKVTSHLGVPKIVNVSDGNS